MLLTVTTDWLTVYTAIGQLLITCVGFWLLYTTFILQAKIAVDQQRMLEIENRRARREIRPVFKLTGEYRELGKKWYIFYFQSELNDAYDLKLSSKSGSCVNMKEPYVELKFLRKDSKLGHEYRFTDNDLLTSDIIKRPDHEIVLEITFEDVDGFPYKQVLRGPHCAMEPGRPIPVW